jgi:hypothetical protein
MISNTCSQNINHRPDSETVSTSASQGNLQGRKVEHLPKDNIKSGNRPDSVVCLIFYFFAMILMSLVGM